MLNVILLVVTVGVWSGMVVVYFRKELKEWLDNRYGPTSRKAKPSKPQRRRMYD